MIDFKNYLEQGLQSALDRERNFQEIHDVFASLRTQVSEFSKNSVTLEMVAQKDSEDDDTLISYFEESEGLYLDKNIFFVSDPTDAEYIRWLSKIIFSSNGYPCTMDIDGNHFDAIDKLGLEENIKILLATPSTGQKLFELMKKAGKV